MIGYHYTSLTNWRKIQETGELQLSIIKDRRWKHVAPGKECLFIWTNNPSGLSHSGNIIRVLSAHNDPVIVKLEVTYSWEDLLKNPWGGNYAIHHRGSIGRCIYHPDDPSTLLGRPIPVDRLRCVGTYDLVERLI